MNIYNQRLISKAFESGFDSQEIAAIHGTDLYTLKQIIKTGIQPGTNYTQENPKVHLNVRKGDIFVYPIKDRASVKGEYGIYDLKEAIEEASSYAELIAHEQEFAINVGLTFKKGESYFGYDGGILELRSFFNDYDIGHKPEDHYIPGNIEKVFNYLVQRGYSHKEIDDIVEHCREKKGLILSYSNSIFDKKHKPLPGNEGFDVRVQDITIDSIIGVEPLNDECAEFLESLDED